jgi:hypothetical protein
MKSHLDIGHVAFDPKTPVVDESVFNNSADWKEFDGEVQEELPPKMPKPRGQRVTISAFVDANHVGNKVTRHSHTGIIIMFRMLRSFGAVKDRIQLRQLLLEVKWLLCGFVKS